MTFFSLATVSFILWEIILPRIGLRSLSQRTRSSRFRGIARQFCALAIQLGGVMIKVGQFLSARLDVLPAEVTEELSSLQDEVPVEDFTQIRRLAEVELGGSLEARFASFDPTPLAAASLGQVHRACLPSDDPLTPDFRDVVVKIQRPFIEQVIEVDLSALRRFGGWLEHYPPIRKRVDVRALIEEFSATIRLEIDYLNEGKNAETFAMYFKDKPTVHVPRVVWSHTTLRVLTLEDVYAIKITDYDAITAAGIDRADVARELIGAYLKQFFEDGFFHADPHPGNLFVTPFSQPIEAGKPAWRLTFVDFGMAGRVPGNLRSGLRELLIAVGMRDPDRLVGAYQKLDILLPGADLELLKKAEAQVFERFWGKSMSELRQISFAEMHEFAKEFRELLFDMPFQLPNNLLMMGRAVAILSGMATGLNPDFNLWEQLAPYAQQLVAEEAGSSWQIWLAELGEMVRGLIALPSQTGRVLGLMEQGAISVQVPQISKQIASLEKSVNRLSGSLVFSVFLISSVLLLNAGNEQFAAISLAAAVIALLWLFLF